MRLFYTDGNPLNCRKDNLSNQYGKMKLNSRSVIIEYDDTYIFITDKKTGKTFVTYYEEELLYLLASPRISWSLGSADKGRSTYYRLIAKVTYQRKVCYGCYSSLSELVYGYYHFNVRANNLTTTLRKMKKELRSRGLVVEHLIADEFNNTKANLSLVSVGVNSEKHIIDNKIQEPYYLIMAYKNGIYKAIYGISLGMFFVAPIVTATSMDSLLKDLKKILSRDVFDIYMNPLKYSKEQIQRKKLILQDNYKIQKYMYDNFEDDYLDLKIGEYIDAVYCE